VAKVCNNVANESETSVIGLIAPYGSGKSSILTITEDEIKAQVGWKVARFNPWLFSNIDTLLLNYFQTLRAAIGKKGNRRLRRKLSEYALNIAPFASLGGLVGGPDTSKIFESAGKLLRGDASAESQRDEIAQILRNGETRYLVIVDDLDRLPPTELLLMLKLIRLGARLPRIYYLIAFDERTLLDVISRSDLAHDDHERARDYLEKIVQVRMDLPPLHHKKQLDLFLECMKQVMDEHGIAMTEEVRELLLERYVSMAPYFRQPRAINRFFAQLSAIYPLVVGEIDFPDFVVLTFLRTFETRVYENLHAARDLLLKTGLYGYESLFGKPDPAGEKSAWLRRLEHWGVSRGNEEIIFRLLVSTFPSMEGEENSFRDRPSRSHMQLNRPVANVQYFDRYFQYGITEFDILDSLVMQAIHDASAGKSSGETVQLARGLTSNTSFTLSKVHAIAPYAKIEDASKLLIFILDNGPFSRPSHDGGIEIHLRQITSLLFSRVAISAIDNLAHEVCRSTSMTMLTHLALPRHGNAPAPNWVTALSGSTKKLLRAHFESLSNAPLQDAPEDTGFLLRHWLVFDTKEYIREWLWNVIDDGKWDISSVLAELATEAINLDGAEPRRVINESELAEVTEDLLGGHEVIKRYRHLIADEPDSLDSVLLVPTRANNVHAIRPLLRKLAFERES